MKILNGERYFVDNSDILITVLNVVYSCNEYIKARITLTNIANGIVYENKYYKLNCNRIKHWKKYRGIDAE